MKNVVTVITFVGVLLTISMTGFAFADHPLYNNHKHFWGSTDICFLESEFDNMNVVGSTGNGEDVADETDDAISDWNDQSSSFRFNKQNTCSHEVGATNLSGGTIGLTTFNYDWLGYINDVDFDFDTSGRIWQTDNTCTVSTSPNIEYVATHELGHWIQFVDANSGTQAHTVMWGAYNCNALNIQTDDAEELDDVY